VYDAGDVLVVLHRFFASILGDSDPLSAGVVESVRSDLAARGLDLTDTDLELVSLAAHHTVSAITEGFELSLRADLSTVDP
jgi:hypothetical protein